MNMWRKIFNTEKHTKKHSFWDQLDEIDELMASIGKYPIEHKLWVRNLCPQTSEKELRSKLIGIISDFGIKMAINTYKDAKEHVALLTFKSSKDKHWAIPILHHQTIDGHLVWVDYRNQDCDIHVKNTDESAEESKVAGANNLPVIAVGNKLKNGDAFQHILLNSNSKISFHRTLRVPEDGNEYPLPAGFGALPIHRVEDYAEAVPEQWLEEGGFFVPLYQKEALFIQFEGEDWCPMISKVFVGNVNAITGKGYTEDLSRNFQDYLVIPKQKWLDGIKSQDKTVKQFVAMPLGQGYTIEAQVADEETHGGIQFLLFNSVEGKFEKPDFRFQEKVKFLKKICLIELDNLKHNLTNREKLALQLILDGSIAGKAAFLTGLTINKVIDFYNHFRKQLLDVIAQYGYRYFGKDNTYLSIINEVYLEFVRLGFREDIQPERPTTVKSDAQKIFTLEELIRMAEEAERPCQSPKIHTKKTESISKTNTETESGMALFSSPSPSYSHESDFVMGIAAGGNIKQQIIKDIYGVEYWDPNKKRILKIHIVNSLAYKMITGEELPASPITAETYEKLGIPWYSYYDEGIPSIGGAKSLSRVMGVDEIDKKRGLLKNTPNQIDASIRQNIHSIKTPEISELVQELRMRAHANVEAGLWNEALRDVDMLLDLKSGVLAEDYVMRSVCNYNIYIYSEAIIDTEIALRLDPGSIQAIESRGRIKIKIGDIEGAMTDANHLMKQRISEKMGLEILAEAHYHAGSYPDALSSAQLLVGKYPDNATGAKIIEEVTQLIQ